MKNQKKKKENKRRIPLDWHSFYRFGSHKDFFKQNIFLNPLK